MNRFKTILSTSLLTLALSSVVMAGDITGRPIARAGDITGKPGDITGKPGDITGKPGDITGKPGDITGLNGVTIDALLGLLNVIIP